MVVQNQFNHLLSQAIIEGDSHVLLSLAQELAQKLSQQDLSKTQVRAAYSAARRLDREQDAIQIKQRLAVVNVRLRYLTKHSEIASQHGSMKTANYEALVELEKLVRVASGLITSTDDKEKMKGRARQLVELFQALLAYQALARTDQYRAIRAPNDQERDALIQSLRDGDGGVIFSLAEKVAGQGQQLDLTKTQLRNIYGTLKNLQSGPTDEEMRRQLWLLEPRLVYTLSKDNRLEALVRVLRNGLVILHELEAGKPEEFDRYFANYVRLAEAIVGLQVYRQAGGRLEQRAIGKEDPLRKAIEQDDGKALSELALKVAQSVALAESSLSRGQVRTLYNKVRTMQADNFSPESLSELQRLRAILSYAIAREPKLKPLFDELNAIISLVFEPKEPEQQRQRAFWLADFFEAVVAWQTVSQYRKGSRQEKSQPTTLNITDFDNALKGDGVAATALAKQIAKNIGKSGQDLGSGQLRTVFTMLKQEAANARLSGISAEKFRRRLWLMLPRLAYATARLPELAPLEELARLGLEKVLTAPGAEGTGPEALKVMLKKLDPLIDLLEGIVAFHYINNPK
jgi:CRISPR type III-A-associated protein Csm2